MHRSKCHSSPPPCYLSRYYIGIHCSFLYVPRTFCWGLLWSRESPDQMLICTPTDSEKGQGRSKGDPRENGLPPDPCLLFLKTKVSVAQVLSTEPWLAFLTKFMLDRAPSHPHDLHMGFPLPGRQRVNSPSKVSSCCTSGGKPSSSSPSRAPASF